MGKENLSLLRDILSTLRNIERELRYPIRYKDEEEGAKGNDYEEDNLLYAGEVLRVAVEKGLQGGVLSAVEEELRKAQSLSEFVKACPSLALLTYHVDSPFHVMWNKEFNAAVIEVHALSWYDVKVQPIQVVWDRVEKFEPCSDWYALAMYNLTQEKDAYDALVKALRPSDWIWVKDHLKKENYNDWMKTIISREKPELYMHIFSPAAPPRPFPWYDVEFIAELDAVSSEESKGQWKYCADHWKPQTYENIFTNIAQSMLEKDVPKVPLCRWPADALLGLKRANNSMWNRICNVKPKKK